MSKSSKPLRSLPESPSEEHLRKEAKRYAKEHGIVLADAQRQLAHEYGFRNWEELMLRVKKAAAASVSEGETLAKQSEAGNVFPFLPLRELVAFPHVVYPVFVGRPESINAVKSAEQGKTPIAMAAQKNGSIANPSSADLYEIGTLGNLSQVIRLPDGTFKTIIEGRERVRVTRFLVDQGLYRAEVQRIAEPVEARDVGTLIDSVIRTFMSSRFQSPAATSAIFTNLSADPSLTADKIASFLPLSLAETQELLETIEPAERLRRILAYLNASRSETSNAGQ